MSEYLSRKDLFYAKYGSPVHSRFKRFAIWDNMKAGEWYYIEDVPAYQRFKPKSLQKLLLMDAFEMRMSPTNKNRKQYRRKELEEKEQEVRVQGVQEV